jgi:adenylosuccinate synthase
MIRSTSDSPTLSTTTLSSATPAFVPSPPPPQAHAAVVGLQWGDEGKGKIVDWLAEDFDVVVRYNGGANAGHSVVIGDTRHALHLVPCGILRPGTLNVIGNGVVLDPALLCDEIAGLEASGIAVGINLRISDRAHVVFPYHKQADALLEAALAAAAGEDRAIGTTGRGIGPCYADKATRSTAVRVGDLLEPELLRQKLRLIAAVKNATLSGLAQLADQPFTPVDPDALADEFLGYAERLRPHVADTAVLLHGAMAAGRRVLFEGGNGSLLDVDHGSYPYVTSSSTTSLGIYPGAGVPGGQVGRIVGIMKAYTTRVGGGPFPTEQDNAIGAQLRERGREYGTTTGRPRRCGWLDLVAVRHSARLGGATELAVMLLDVLAGLHSLKVCIGYRHAGRDFDTFPASATVLAELDPVYVDVPGFSEEVTACQDHADLPAAARDYIDLIERVVGVPVRVVSVGPERTQTLLRG